MAKAGWCRECNANVWLGEDGACPNGHPRSSLRNIYEVAPPAVATAPTGGRRSQSTWRLFAGGAVLLGAFYPAMFVTGIMMLGILLGRGFAPGEVNGYLLFLLAMWLVVGFAVGWVMGRFRLGSRPWWGLPLLALGAPAALGVVLTAGTPMQTSPLPGWIAVSAVLMSVGVGLGVIAGGRRWREDDRLPVTPLRSWLIAGGVYFGVMLALWASSWTSARLAYDREFGPIRASAEAATARDRYEPDETTPTAHLMTDGQVEQHTIYPLSDKDWFAVDVPAMQNGDLRVGVPRNVWFYAIASTEETRGPMVLQNFKQSGGVSIVSLGGHKDVPVRWLFRVQALAGTDAPLNYNVQLTFTKKSEYDPGP